MKLKSNLVFPDGTTQITASASASAMNYAQTQATKQSGISASGVTIVSTNITTKGYPVEILVTGDAENSTAGGWIKLQLYRDSTAIGKIIHVESSAGSENVPYALTVIDTPSAGTYSYSLKTASAAAVGTFNFGETDGPVLTAIELAGAQGATGATGPAGTSPPTGGIMQYAGSTAPSGWLLCDGTAVSRSTYSALFSAIGTTYGSGDGSTTFNLPDTRGRVPLGAGTGTGLTARTLGATGGVESVTLTSAQSGLVGHSHTNTVGNQSVDHTHTLTTGGISANHVHDASHQHYISQTTSASSGAHNNTGGYVAAGTNGSPTSSNLAVQVTTMNTGTVSSDHTHSGTSSGMSASHNHSVTIDSAASANASASHDNMTPYIVFNHIIKT